MDSPPRWRCRISLACSAVIRPVRLRMVDLRSPRSTGHQRSIARLQERRSGSAAPPAVAPAHELRSRGSCRPLQEQKDHFLPYEEEEGEVLSWRRHYPVGPLAFGGARDPSCGPASPAVIFATASPVADAGGGPAHKPALASATTTTGLAPFASRTPPVPAPRGVRLPSSIGRCPWRGGTRRSAGRGRRPDDKPATGRRARETRRPPP